MKPSAPGPAPPESQRRTGLAGPSTYASLTSLTPGRLLPSPSSVPWTPREFPAQAGGECWGPGRADAGAAPGRSRRADSHQPTERKSQAAKPTSRLLRGHPAREGGNPPLAQPGPPTAPEQSRPGSGAPRTDAYTPGRLRLQQVRQAAEDAPAEADGAGSQAALETHL